MREMHPGEGMKPYRPSNGTEGAMFMAQFCDRCIHDTTDFDRWDGCEIAAMTMAVSVTHDDYPPEWVEIDGEPQCTKFSRRPDGWDQAPTDPHSTLALSQEPK